MIDWTNSVLEIALTLGCNLKCAHCFTYGEPEKNEHSIGKDEVVEIIAPYIKRGGTSVSFTGGECTLNMESLLSGIFFASGHGLKTGVATNGWWGKDHLDEYIAMFSAVGLTLLCVTFDKFHADAGAEWQNVKRILGRGVEYGIYTTLSWCTAEIGVNAQVLEAVKLVGPDYPIILQKALRIGYAVHIARGKRLKMGRTFEVSDWQCRELQGERAAVGILPGGFLYYRCESRNPRMIHPYRGDWTEKVEQLDRRHMYRELEAKGLHAFDRLKPDTRAYHDGCDMCHDLAGKCYPRDTRIPDHFTQ